MTLFEIHHFHTNSYVAVATVGWYIVISDASEMFSLIVIPTKLVGILVDRYKKIPMTC